MCWLIQRKLKFEFLTSKQMTRESIVTYYMHNPLLKL